MANAPFPIPSHRTGVSISGIRLSDRFHRKARDGAIMAGIRGAAARIPIDDIDIAEKRDPSASFMPP